MVLNEFLSWHRRVARRALPMRAGALADAVAPVDDPADEVVERDALIALIATLPPRQRAVVALRYYEDCSDAEIAELLGCRVATVRSHAARALATLRSTAEPALDHPIPTGERHDH